MELQEFLEQKANAGPSYSIVARLRWDLRQIFRLAVAEASLLKSPEETLFIPWNAPQPVRRVMNLFLCGSFWRLRPPGFQSELRENS